MRAANMVALLARRLMPGLWVVPLALVLSCADMPNSPKAVVHATGTILDKNGQGMFAVAIYFHVAGLRFDPRTGDPTNLPPGEEPVYRAVTNADGSYDLQMPEGTYRIVAVPLESSGYAPAVVQSVRIGRDSPKWDYRYAWPTVTFRTVDPVGAAIANSLVGMAAHPQVYDPDFYIYVQGRRIGDVVEAVVPPGNYDYIVAPGGYSSGYLDSRGELSVSADTSITVTAGGYTVSARVVGRGGDPIPNAYVSTNGATSSARSMTDFTGNASFHLPSGSYTFYVNMADPYVAGREFRNISIAGDASIDLDMGGTEWTGTVRRNGDGAPQAGLTVVARETFGQSQTIAETGLSGTFRLIVRTGRAHDITVVKGGFWQELGSFPSVPAGADSTFDLYVNMPTP